MKRSEPERPAAFPVESRYPYRSTEPGDPADALVVGRPEKLVIEPDWSDPNAPFVVTDWGDGAAAPPFPTRFRTLGPIILMATGKPAPPDVSKFPPMAHNEFAWRTAPLRTTLSDGSEIGSHDEIELTGRQIAAASSAGEERNGRLLQFVQAGRTRQVIAETEALRKQGRTDEDAEELARSKCDSSDPARFSHCTRLDQVLEGLAVETTVRAVQYNDEDTLAAAQEHIFGLGTSLRRRAALARFLVPYLSKTTSPEERLKQILCPEVRPIRAARIIFDPAGNPTVTNDGPLSAESPGLYVRISVLDKMRIWHKSDRKVRPIPLNGKPLLALAPDLPDIVWDPLEFLARQRQRPIKLAELQELYAKNDEELPWELLRLKTELMRCGLAGNDFRYAVLKSYGFTQRDAQAYLGLDNGTFQNLRRRVNDRLRKHSPVIDSGLLT